MKSLLIVISVLLITSLHAQEYPRKEVDLQHIADNLYGFQDIDLNYEELYENLAQLLSNPINLNKATAEDLHFIKILSEDQIKNLLAYRNEFGNFISLYELQSVPGFDLVTLYNLAPFVNVADPSGSLNSSLWRRVQHDGDRYLIIRYERTLQSKKGFTHEVDADDQFHGSPDKLYVRFRNSRPGDFSFGFTLEKDAGEKITWSTSHHQYGMDYLSFHAQLQNKGRLKNIVLGNYQGQFGQGLMLGGIFGMGKGGETITTTRRTNLGILPYTSVYEAGYLRGVAATVELTRHFFITGFYSFTRRDANIEISNEDDPFISSLQNTGLHRNNNELAKRQKIGEINFGSVVQYKNKQLEAGLMVNQVSFDLPINRSPSVYNQFNFNGRKNINTGLYLNYTFQNASFFSEYAQTLHAGYAYVAGVLWSLTPKLDLSILHRKFEKNFYSFYSNTFAEGSTTQNETGTYWGWKYRFNRKFTTAGYVDLFRFPWLRYRSYAPSNGHEWLLRFSYQRSRKVSLFAQVREESKERNIESDNPNLYLTAKGKKYNYWFQCDYGIGQKLKLKTRAQFSSFSINQHTTHGMALLQDIGIDLGRIELTARYALFDTDDYDNRQYVYERDVWLAFSLPAYYNQGVRNYFLLEYKLNKQISLWLRYAHTRYQHQDEIGSGVDSIEGNIRNDVKFQARIKF